MNERRQTGKQQDGGKAGGQRNVLQVAFPAARGWLGKADFILAINSTASMTEKIVASARAVVADGVEVEGRTAAGAPPSIQGHHDEVMCAAHLLREVREAERASALGWTVSLLPAPWGQDWNDVVVKRGAA